MSTARELAERCGKARASGMGWMCKCPCHDDKTCSLWVADSTNGTIYVDCKAGCDFKAVRTALGLESQSPPSPYTTSIEVSYNYHSADGKLVFQKLRGADKKFRIRRKSGDSWVYNMQGITERPLYNLPAIKRAISAGQKIAILEGEKDCDNFKKCTGIEATCNFDGASTSTQKPKWTSSYSEALTDADVLILYDNDEPGIAHRDSIIASLKIFARSITVVHLPSELNDKHVKDFSDWLAAGGDAEKFFTLRMEVIKEYKEPEIAIRVSDWLRMPEEPVVPILKNVFDKGDKVVVIGKSKMRKSFFSLQLAFCLVSGRPFLGFEASDPVRVLLVQSEVKKARFHERVKRMAESMSLCPNEVEGLLIYNARGVANLQLAVEQQVLEHKPDVVIIDPLYKMIAGDENKIEEVKPILKFFDQLAERTNAAVVYVHHDKKGMTGDLDLVDRGSGSGVLARDFDAAMLISQQEETETTIVIEFLCRNYAPLPAIAADWTGSIFMPSDAAAKKKTSHSKPKPKSPDEIISIARAAVTSLYENGNRTIRMMRFNAELHAAGLPKSSLALVKEELSAAGLITIERGKGNGSGGKTVTLAPPVQEQSAPQVSYIESDEHEMPF